MTGEDAESRSTETNLTPISTVELTALLESASDGGTKIIPSEYTEENLPAQYDLSKVPIEYQEKVNRYLDGLRIYALSPTHDDNFPDHNAREKWQARAIENVFNAHGAEAEAQFRALIDNNRFSGNRVTYAHQAVNILPRFGVDLPKDQTQAIIEGAKQMVVMQQSGEWNRVTTEERMKLTDEIADNAASIVQSFNKPGWRIQSE